MNTITHVAETVQRIIGEEVEQLAREVGFIQRLRVRSLADFVQSLILGWLQEPEITLDGLTQVLERREVSISASGLSQRFTPEAATLLHRVLERLSPTDCATRCLQQVVALKKILWLDLFFVMLKLYLRIFLSRQDSFSPKGP